MEKYKVLQIDPKDGWQRVQVLRADGKKIWASDSSNHPFQVGQSYEGDFNEKDNVKNGRSYHNYYFGAILPAESPLATPESEAAEAKSIATQLLPYFDHDRDERIMRGNALNAAAAALGPWFGTWHTETPELTASEMSALLIASAESLVPFLRGDHTAFAFPFAEAAPQNAPAQPPETQRPELQAPKERVETSPTAKKMLLCPEHGEPSMKTSRGGETVYAHKQPDGSYCFKTVAEMGV